MHPVQILQGGTNLIAVSTVSEEPTFLTSLIMPAMTGHILSMEK
jgi:hypothetical protein